MLSNSVEGKHVVITGGASGIGAQTARLLVDRGAKVFIGDLNSEAGDALVTELDSSGESIAFGRVDVTDKVSVEAFYNQAVATFGNIDVGLNNAGVDHNPVPLHEVSDEEYHRNIAVNLTGGMVLHEGAD